MPDHRRVEPRTIAGTGMATDPERIHAVAAEAERHARSWRPAPDATFDHVLERAPPKGELADVSASSPTPTEPTKPDTDETAGAPVSDPSARGPRVVGVDQGSPLAERRQTRRLSPRAPDPRERLLHAKLDDRVGAAAVVTAASASSPSKKTH